MSKVTLVGITQPTKHTGCETAAELVAYAARVSNPSNQTNKLTSKKLIKYLVKHKHWSPFEMVSITMEIETTREISRQILRHRSFSFQEFSQRYAESENWCLREARMQDTANRQNSIELTVFDDRHVEWKKQQKDALAATKKAYNWALKHGIAKEQARAVLPEGLTETKLYMSGTLRSWLHYCDLRTRPETQKEHRIVAKLCWKVVKQCFPEVKDLLK